MRPDHLKRQRQHGFSIVVAVFILVVLSLLAATMLRVQETDAAGAAQDTLTVRAFYAAESGAQYAMNRLLLDGAACGALGLPNGTAAWDATELAQCSVDNLTCTADSLNGVDYYHVTSTAACRGSADERFVARRTIEVRVRN